MSPDLFFYGRSTSLTLAFQQRPNKRRVLCKRTRNVCTNKNLRIEDSKYDKTVLVSPSVTSFLTFRLFHLISLYENSLLWISLLSPSTAVKLSTMRPEVQQELSHILLTELLAYQFASPVRWYVFLNQLHSLTSLSI